MQQTKDLELKNLNANIKGLKNWLNENTDVKLLFTQKEGVRFLYLIILTKRMEIQTKESMKNNLIDLIKDDKLIGVDGKTMNFEEVENLFIGNQVNNLIDNVFTEEFKDKPIGKNYKIPFGKITMDSWNDYKPSRLYSKNNDRIDIFTRYLNDIANSVINLNSIPQDLYDLLGEIDKNRVEMTFDEEANKLFDEGELLIRMVDIESIDKSSDNGMAIVCLNYKEKWELFLLWVVSNIKHCICVLHCSLDAVSIIGNEKNLDSINTLYDSYKGEIKELADAEARRKRYRDQQTLGAASKSEKEISRMDKEGKEIIADYLAGAIAGLNFVKKSEKDESNDIFYKKSQAYILEKFPSTKRKYYKSEHSPSNIDEESFYYVKGYKKGSSGDFN